MSPTQIVHLCRILGWSAFAAVIVTIVVYLLNWPLATYDIYVRSDTHGDWGLDI